MTTTDLGAAAFGAALLLTLPLACEQTPSSAQTPAATSGAPTMKEPPSAIEETLPIEEKLRSRFPAAPRVIAIGDVHGDLNATRAALELAGVIDGQGKWSGGSAVVVQTGDILDRGDDEQAIIELFDALAQQAKSAGGAVHVLNGNHELMNVALDFRYVTAGGFRDFEDARGVQTHAPELSRVPEAQRARTAAFRPGGVYARKLARKPTALVVGDTVYAHGGVLPEYARYGIERINSEVAQWMLGRGVAGMRIVNKPDSPVWSRHYSDEPDADDCKLLDQALSILKAKRMVVGHTVKKTITSACDDKVWHIDVGMAAHYGGHPEALEITSEGARPLRE